EMMCSDAEIEESVAGGVGVGEGGPGAPARPQRRRLGIGDDEVTALGARRGVEGQPAVVGLGSLHKPDGAVMREVRGAPESVDSAVIDVRIERRLPVALLAGEGS